MGAAGPAVPQRDARRIVRHGRDLDDPREKEPQISSFPPLLFTTQEPSGSSDSPGGPGCGDAHPGLSRAAKIARLRFLFLGRILTFIPQLVLSAGPAGGSCLCCRKDTGDKPPGTKERMQGPARKELYWHDPTGSLRHPQRPGCQPREGCPQIPAEPLGGCKEASQGARGAVSVPKGTVPEVRLCAWSCKERRDPPRCHQGRPKFGTP